MKTRMGCKTLPSVTSKAESRHPFSNSRDEYIRVASAQHAETNATSIDARFGSVQKAIDWIQEIM